MILPSDIVPGALGLAWGMARADCLRVLGERGRSLTEEYVAASLTVRGMQCEFYVRFDRDDHLISLEAVVSMDDSPWDADITREQIDEIYAEYRSRYARIVEQYLPLLGPPSFSGDHDVEGFPREYFANEVTYWETPTGRIVIRWQHQDRELPIMVIVASYPPRVEPTKR